MLSQNMSSRVKQEIDIHSRLSHPSIVKLYSHFEDHKYVYLVLELCHNGGLQDYLRLQEKPLQEKEGGWQGIILKSWFKLSYVRSDWDVMDDISEQSSSLGSGWKLYNPSVQVKSLLLIIFTLGWQTQV